MYRDRRTYLVLIILLLSSLPALAQIFGTVRVVVRDPQNLAVTNAQIVLRAKTSEWMQTASSNGEGIAVIPAVPIGDYRVSISASGFTTARDREIRVTSDKVTPVPVQLEVGGVEQSVNVTWDRIMATAATAYSMSFRGPDLKAQSLV